MRTKIIAILICIYSLVISIAYAFTILFPPRHPRQSIESGYQYKNIATILEKVDRFECVTYSDGNQDVVYRYGPVVINSVEEVAILKKKLLSSIIFSAKSELPFPRSLSGECGEIALVDKQGMTTYRLRLYTPLDICYFQDESHVASIHESFYPYFQDMVIKKCQINPELIVSSEK